MSDGRDEAAAHLASCFSPPPHRVIPGRLPEWRRAVAYQGYRIRRLSGAWARASSFETPRSAAPQDEAQLHPVALNYCRILIPHPEGPPQAGVSKDGRSRASSRVPAFRPLHVAPW